MSDDLFEHLRTVDPVTEERITRETRALGNRPGRIMEGEPSNVRRFPKTARRKARLLAVAAVVVAAIAAPLALLRPLGDGGLPGAGSPTPGGDGRHWVTVGSVFAIRARGVIYEPDLDAFIFAPTGAEPYALLAHTEPLFEPFIPVRYLYCEPAHRFIDTAGNVFDDQGTLLAGTGGYAMGRYQRTRVVDGSVQVDTTQTFQNFHEVPAGDDARDAPDCPTVDGRYLPGAPGFAIADETSIPSIAIAFPLPDMSVPGPVTISGSADVFEATVSIRVLDENGDVLAETFAVASCGTGCRGDFTTQIDIPIDVEQAGTIQVFESSAKDGSMVNTVEIPVTLLPAEASASSATDGGH